jgi:hypothetical protein
VIDRENIQTIVNSMRVDLGTDLLTFEIKFAPMGGERYVIYATLEEGIVVGAFASLATARELTDTLQIEPADYWEDVDYFRGEYRKIQSEHPGYGFETEYAIATEFERQVF